MKMDENNHQLIESFLHSETSVKKAEEKYRELLRTDKHHPNTQTTYESIIDAMDQLDNAFEEILNRTDLRAIKLRYSA